MLYRPEDFEPLVDEPWDEARVREAIQTIVVETDEAFGAREFWPAHEWDAWELRQPLTDLYGGAAGVVWALDALRRRGHAETSLDLTAAVTRALELWRAEPLDRRRHAAPVGGRVLAVPRRERDPRRRLAAGAGRRSGRQARHARTRERRQRGRGAAVGLTRHDARRPCDARLDRGGTLGRSLARERRCAARAARRGWASGRSSSTAWSRGDASALRMVSSGTSMHCCRVAPTPELERETAAILAAEAVREDGLANWPAQVGDGLEDKRGRDPRPVVPRRARDRHDRGAVPRRGAAGRGRRADLAGRARTEPRRGQASATGRPETATRS